MWNVCSHANTYITYFCLCWVYDKARFCFWFLYIVSTSRMLMPLFVFLLWCRPRPCLYIVYIFVDTKKFVKSSFLWFLGFGKNWLNGTCLPHFCLLYYGVVFVSVSSLIYLDIQHRWWKGVLLLNIHLLSFCAYPRLYGHQHTWVLYT